MGWFTSPGDEWTARDVFLFGGILDSLRFWQAPPSVHDAKRGAHGLAYEAMVADGTIRKFGEDLHREGLDLRRALILLAERETRTDREMMLYSVFTLLAARGIKI